MTEPDGATPLDPDEKAGLRFPNIVSRGQLDQIEQINITSGLQWLAGRRNVDIFDEKFIRDLHQRLFGQVWSWAGTFRKTEKNIGVDPLRISVDLRNLLDDARAWSEYKTYQPVECAARLHHRLVKIHCFANGNGRHARILADALLVKHYKTKPINWGSGSSELTSQTKHRQAYLAALRDADVGNYAPLLAFVVA